MENLKSKIDEVLETLKFDKDKAVFSMTPTEDENKRILELKAGSWDSNDIWFFIDEKDKIHPMVPFDAIKNLAVLISEQESDNFALRLEHSIRKYLPVDYNDVLAVAIEESKSLVSSKKVANISNIDTDALIHKIKNKHSNLFLDF